MKYIVLLLLSCVGGCLNFAGGENWGTKWRDLGVPTCAILTLLIFNHFDCSVKFLLSYFLTFLLLFGALTTYFKKKGTDAKWYNWLLCGLSYGLAFIPFCILTGNWAGLWIRTLVLCIGTVTISEWQDDVFKESFGRGSLIIITIPILFM